MRDFLDLEDDGSVAFVHEAHRLKRVRLSHTEDYFKTFISLFKGRFSKNKLVFLSAEPFFRQLPNMKHVGIKDGKVDNEGWPTFKELEADFEHAEDLRRRMKPYKVRV